METKKKEKNTHIWQLLTATSLIVVGVILLIISFFVDPLGKIDGSVLTALGEILTFAGSLFGIDYHYKAKTSI